MVIAEERMDGAHGSVSGYDETSAELLRTIAGVLDIHPILPRLSEIANRMLPTMRWPWVSSTRTVSS